jgi:hypothetical protein
MDSEVVTIPKKEYEELLERDAWLRALEAAGVDNWQGFDCAQEIYEEEMEQV